MRRLWERWAARIEARTLRERALGFAAAIALLVGVVYVAVLGPMFEQYSALRQQIDQQNNNVAGLSADIADKIAQGRRDPDAASRAQLAQLQAEAVRRADALRAMQRGLVPAEKMTGVLERLLRAQPRVRLVAMRTLPVSPVDPGQPLPLPAAAPAPVSASGGDERRTAERVMRAARAESPAAAAPADAAKSAAKAGSLLYRHGVELSLRGNYLDLVDYMGAVQAMPARLFWSQAQIEVEHYPTARLTLTLHTLSLDPTWMTL